MPTYRKTDDKKGVMRTNLQDREDAIKLLGEEEFYAIKENEQYKDVDIPPIYATLFNDYIDINNMTGESGVTWTEVDSYSRLTQKTFSLHDIEILVKINVWANSEKNKMQDYFNDGTNSADDIEENED